MGTTAKSDMPGWGEFFPILGVTYALKQAVVSYGTAGELPQLHRIILT